MKFFWSAIVVTFLMVGCAPLKNSPFSEETDTKLTNYNHVNLFDLESSQSLHDDEVVFGVISDSHQNYTSLQDWVGVANNSDLDFTISLGDFTNQGLNFEYDAYLKSIVRLKKPHFTIMGNHDTLTKGKLLYRRIFGEYNFSFFEGGYKFIFFNNNRLDFLPIDLDWQWLEEELASSTLPKVVMMHVNPDNDEYFTAEQIEYFKEIFQSFNVRLVLHGHHHVFLTFNEGTYVRHQVQRTEGVYWSRITLSREKVLVERCQRRECTHDISKDHSADLSYL